MAVRPIDAVQVLHNINLHHRPTPLSEFESGFNDGLNQAMWEITHAPTLTQPNEPLTLEVLAKSQLLQMLGEKVEVIRMGEMCQAEWATVRSFGDCKTDSGCSCCHELYGKTWIAYRRPPEGEEEEKHVIEITENL